MFRLRTHSLPSFPLFSSDVLCRAKGGRHFIYTLPCYGSMTVFTFVTVMLSSGVGSTVKLDILRVRLTTFGLKPILLLPCHLSCT